MKTAFQQRAVSAYKLLRAGHILRAPGEPAIALDLYGTPEDEDEDVTICEVRLAGHHIDIVTRFRDDELDAMAGEVRRHAAAERRDEDIESRVEHH
jgi:hypothetical protein